MTVTIDAWTVVSIIIPLMLAALLWCFFDLTETKNRLRHEEWKSSYYEHERDKYRSKFMKYYKKYKDLK